MPNGTIGRFGTGVDFQILLTFKFGINHEYMAWPPIYDVRPNNEQAVRSILPNHYIVNPADFDLFQGLFIKNNSSTDVQKVIFCKKLQ